MSYLDEVFKQTADGGYFDFTRCQKPNGQIYGTRGKCRSGTEIGAKEETASAPKAAPAAQKPAKLGGAKVGTEKRLMALSVSQLQQLRADPRLYDYQKKKIDDVIAKKGGEAPDPGKKAQVQKKSKKADAETKKAADSSSNSAEKRWLNDDKNIKEIKARHEEIIKQYEKETGKTVTYAPGPVANEIHRRLKAAGLPSRDQLTKMEMAHRDAEPESLKQERRDKEEAKRQEGLKMSKADRRTQIREMMQSAPDQWYGKDIASLTQSIQTLKGFMKEPSLDTIENRNKLVALRALRMKYVAAEQAKRRALAIDAQSAVKDSPTYSSTPGSSRLLSNAAKKLGGAAQEFVDKKKRLEELDEQIKKIEASSADLEDRKKAGYQQLDDERKTLRGELIRLERRRDFVPLQDIYKAQGFNAKPELVATRGDLERRTDLATGRDGRPIIAFRGVSEQKFADQFRGLGDEGDIHFAGTGVYGNGSYAAAAAAGRTRDVAIRTAQSYASSAEGTNARVTAFGFRNDANIVTFEGTNQDERYDNYVEWQRKIRQTASDRTGLPVDDPGHAAAIMGIHAYQVPMARDEDYWVVLNRGATIQAVDAQI